MVMGPVGPGNNNGCSGEGRYAIQSVDDTTFRRIFGNLSDYTPSHPRRLYSSKEVADFACSHVTAKGSPGTQSSNKPYIMGIHTLSCSPSMRNKTTRP
jgi:hypothetical protein